MMHWHIPTHITHICRTAHRVAQTSFPRGLNLLRGPTQFEGLLTLSWIFFGENLFLWSVSDRTQCLQVLLQDRRTRFGLISIFHALLDDRLSLVTLAKIAAPSAIFSTAATQASSLLDCYPELKPKFYC